MTSDDTASKMQSLLYELNQIFIVFQLQLRLYSKRKYTYLLFFLPFLIPILAYTGVAKTILEAFGFFASSSYLLILLPFLILLIPAKLAGEIISSEYKNRTAYIMLSLPISRTTFFLGKFLAALVLSIGVFSLAYGFAIIAGAGLYDVSSPNDTLGSFVICIAALFAFTATISGLSPYFKRGSGWLGLLLVILPVVLASLIDVYFGETSSLWNVRVLPIFSAYPALLSIDAGVGGFYVGLFQALSGSYDTWIYIISSTAWGIVFILLGLLRVKGKEL